MPWTPPLTAASHRSDLKAGVWQCLRWMLVLALIFDLLSAPLHRHHHEGVDSPLDFPATHAPISGAQPYAHGHERPPFVHAAAAIRIDLSSFGRLPGSDADDAAPPALLSLLERLAAADTEPVHDWQPAASGTDFRSYRSLPPAGRAPPLHA